jgi:hypothetical protein
MDKRGFPNKYYKLIKDSTFMEEAEAMDVDGLKAKIVQSEEKLYAIEKAKESDENFIAAKNRVKEFSSAYNEASAYEKAKLQFCLFVMESRGYEMAEKDDTEV